MGLACSQIRLLTLTARKADCEYGISMNSLQKMSLTREMSNLSQEYYNKLKNKQVCYFSDGKYNLINASYLMGYCLDYNDIANGTAPVKDNMSMILADFKGRTVLHDNYARAVASVLPNNTGETFSLENLPKILNNFCNNRYSLSEIEAVMNSEKFDSSFEAITSNTRSQEITGETEIDNSEELYNKIKNFLNFYLPIFSSAATNGWTTQYNDEIALNSDYVSDAITSGTLQIVGVDKYGAFDFERNLNYYLTAGGLTTATDADSREEITAWYNTEKERIAEKENYIDIQMTDLSTELEAIKTEIQSIQSLIDDAVQSVFDWGGG